jgi:hypothetical protein
MVSVGIFGHIEITAQRTTRAAKNYSVKKLDKKPVLEARFKDSNFQSGNSIELTLRIKNETNSTIVIFDVLPERGFDIVVKNASGLTLPLTKEGEKIKYPINIIRREGVFISPNNEFTLKTIYLDRMFDLKRTGTYTLEVKTGYNIQDISKKNKSSGNKDNILSSMLHFTVE